MKKVKINDHIIIRSTQKKDTKQIINFIRELAEYEYLTHLVEINELNLQKHIFKENIADVIIIEYDNEPAGFALYFCNFSTFLGKPCIYSKLT